MQGAYLAQLALSAIMPFQAATCPSDFDCVVDEAGFRLFAKRKMPLHLGDQGVILGKIFRRSDMKIAQALSPQEWAELSASRGQTLIERFWGDYVAFLRRPMPDGRIKFDVIRAPLGQLGCYWHVNRQKLIVASEPDVMVQAGLLRPQIDPAALARHIAAPEIAHEKTCLADVYALNGGTRISTGPERPEIELLWSPWHFCKNRPGIRNHEIAAAMLRQVLTQCVAAQMADMPKSILLLSGGLDSSILAACLHIIGHEFHALNLIAESATGDERDYARLAAQATGAGLTEALRIEAEVDILTSRAARCARPHTRAFTQATRYHAARCAEKYGAGVVIDGGGGDNLFFNTPSLTVLVEILRGRGPGPRFWRTSAALADLADTGLGSVVLQTVHRAFTRNNQLRFERRDHFLSARSKSIVEEAPQHPWRDPPRQAGAGKAAHVSVLAPLQATAEQATRMCGSAYWFSPFMCQPAVEVVLSMPIWVWFAPGLNRAAARMAFKNDLPAAVIERRTKGTPDSYVNALFERHRHSLRTLLLDGRLVSMGIIDPDRVREVIDDQAPARDHRFSQVMELADAETWARSWD